MRLEKLIDEKVATDRDLQERQQTLIEPENWPTNSPDLNIVDYSVWGRCNRWCIITISDIDQLKHALIDCWTKTGNIEQSDQSAANKTDDGYQDKWCANDHCCFTEC